MPAAKDVVVRTEDGWTLNATLYEPEEPNGIALQVNSAAATPRRVYSTFAETMAKRGFAVMTYDYRDTFGVEPEVIRRSPACISLWGEKDQPAVTRFLRASYPRHSITLVGHSMGGQFAGLSPAAGELAAVILVSAAHGYWRRYKGYKRWRRALNLFVIWPIVLGIKGYAPGSVMNGAGDKGSAYVSELMRYCRSPYFFCDQSGTPLRPHNADIRCAVKLMTVSDDEVVEPEAAVDVREYYPNARTETELLTPERYGLDRLGHFGLFRRSAQRTSAWAEMASWFESAVRAQA